MFHLSRFLLPIITSLSVLISQPYQASPPCGPGGSAYPGSVKFKSNTIKNRSDFPPDSIIYASITFSDLLNHPFLSNLSIPIQAVEIEAYVFNVKFSYPESCNCYSKNPTYMDTHIELVESLSEPLPSCRIIVEITPRLRQKFRAIGIDWSTEHLQKTILGKKVKVKGWLYYDEDHKYESTAEDPTDTKGNKNWRASAWEIHPLTYLKILN